MIPTPGLVSLQTNNYVSVSVPDPVVSVMTQYQSPDAANIYYSGLGKHPASTLKTGRLVQLGAMNAVPIQLLEQAIIWWILSYYFLVQKSSTQFNHLGLTFHEFWYHVLFITLLFSFYIHHSFWMFLMLPGYKTSITCTQIDGWLSKKRRGLCVTTCPWLVLVLAHWINPGLCLGTINYYQCHCPQPVPASLPRECQEGSVFLS